MRTFLLSLITLFFCFSAFGQNTNNKKESTGHIVRNFTDKNGYQYQTVTNDPAGVRVYKLKNGLTVYLAQDFKEPSINYVAAVRAGSIYDPKNNTGLAHYLEHLLFNGTANIGTLDWEKEAPLLRQLDTLYERHKQEPGQAKKISLDHAIDSISYKASKYGIKGDYRKLLTDIGAVAINGTTNFEYILYGCLIPNTSLDKLLTIEKERFTNPSLRAFRNELEIVYEEYNQGQDNDFRQKYFAANAALFPTHPYGTQQVIGTAEHLKNPSTKAIRAYFDKYYVPNNMAVVLIGNLDFDAAIKKVDEAFGGFKPKPVSRPVFAKETPITKPIELNLTSSQPESAFIGYRLNGIGSADEKYMTLIDVLLNNNVAGLFNLDLVAPQKIKSAFSSIFINNDYSMQYFTGTPLSNQSLENVKETILSELDKLKKGDFDETLISACARDIKRSFLKDITEDNNLDGASAYSFTQFRSWANKLQFYDDLEKITKQQLMDWVSRVYGNNYVVLYKRKGESSSLVKVENPKITPILLNETKESKWGHNYGQTKPEPTKPEFIDFKKAIQQTALADGLRLDYIPSKNKELFKLDIVFDAGKAADKMILLAVNYLNFAGTPNYSLSNWKKEFYKLGLSFTFNTQDVRTVFRLEGLQSSLAKGVELLDYLVNNVTPDSVSYRNYIQSILNNRKLNLNNTAAINSALANYALDGEHSLFRNIFKEEELRSITPDKLTEELKTLWSYPHHIFYYGGKIAELKDAVLKHTHMPDAQKAIPAAKSFLVQPTKKAVYVVYKEGAQATVEFLTRGDKFNREALAPSNLFNRFISNLFFQQVREARSLAYSCDAYNIVSADTVNYNFVETYAATQANKINELVAVETSLLSSIDAYGSFFENAKADQLKRFERERFIGEDIFWNRESLKRQGLNYDYRETIYNFTKTASFSNIKDFFNKNIANRDYSITIIADKKDIDKKELSKYGEVIELDPKYLFNY